MRRRDNSGYRCLTLLGLMALVLAGVPAQALTPLGQLINVGGHRLHLYCSGRSHSGEPTVILEAGLGGTALEWHAVQRNLAASHRVCSYDRAGMGWSDAARGARSIRVAVDELERLLNAAALAGPVVMVGHSIGGYSAQLYARLRPERVAGVVLVDSSHPQQIERFAAPPLQVNIAPKGRLMFLVPVQVPPQLSGHVRALADQLLSHRARVAVTRELQGFRLSARQVATAGPMPDLPLVVVSRGVQKWPRNERGDRMEALWQQLQRELVNETSVSAQIVARRSGHHVHLDQPELVSAAIGAVVAATRHPQGGRRQRQALSRALTAVESRFAALAAIDQEPLRRSLLVLR